MLFHLLYIHISTDQSIYKQKTILEMAKAFSEETFNWSAHLKIGKNPELAQIH